MPHGEEGLGYLLVGGRSSTQAKTRDDARRIDSQEQTEALVPPQAIAPSDVCTTGQPSFASALCVSNGHRRAVQGFVRTSLSFHHLRQVQGHFLDEIEVVAHRAVELRTMGQGMKGISQAGACIAVEVPLAPEASPSGEDGEGDDLAGTERRLGSGVLLCLRAGLAEVVDHDVEYGEEGVHIDHETVPFPSGSV